MSQRKARKNGSRFERGNKPRLAGNDSGLRSAEKLIAAKADQLCSLLECFGRRRLVLAQTERLGGGKRAAAEIDHERYTPAAGQIRD